MLLPYTYINGQLVGRENAHLAVNDLALLRGYGIFDYFRIRQGKPAFWDAHLTRFLRSADLMELELPHSEAEIKSWLDDLIVHNEVENAAVRLLLTGGYSSNGYTPERSNLLMLMHPFEEQLAAHFEKGIRLMPHPYVREIPEIKTINYSMSIILRKKMQRLGADDVLYHKDGWISESSRANFFIIAADGSIATPHQDILFGITRGNLIRLASKEYKIEERPIALEELKEAREAFITSTTKGTLGVTQVGDIQIGNGQTGPITHELKRLLDAFALEDGRRYGEVVKQ
ncbi:MAG: aminotransferase class IV [Bacteroidota bacterium]